MNSLAARRRHPAAIAVLLMLGLFLTGAVYAAIAPKDADATTKALPAQSVEEGKQLFLANCASCHGQNAEGRADRPRRQDRRSGAGRRRRRGGRLPGRHRPDAAVRADGAGARWRAQVHRRGDRLARRLRRVPRPGPGGPLRRGRRPHQGRPGQGWRAVPRQLRDVPQLRRCRWRPDPRQVRAGDRRRSRTSTSTRP